MRGDQFTLHGTIQGMRDNVCHDVLMLQPTTLDTLRKAANIADASTRRSGGAKTSFPLEDLAALMAQLMKNGGANPPAATAMANNTATTAPTIPTTTVTSMAPPASQPRIDVRAVNINLVMQEGTEWTGNTVYAPGQGRGFRRGRARGGPGGWNGRPTPTTFPRQPRTNTTQPPSAARCQNCGYVHEVDNCVAAYAACYNCMNVGHFSCCCPTRGAPAPAQ